MQAASVSAMLRDDYQLLQRYLEGRLIKKILYCTETKVSILMENNVVLDFIHLEDEIIFDITLPSG
ncbi:MAG: hypothetical protein GXY34_08590 [Syntrophomonadaceae bacterium]|nr:hypothetical protein [Syntrophomonadaceae bacterium]